MSIRGKLPGLDTQTDRQIQIQIQIRTCIYILSGSLKPWGAWVTGKWPLWPYEMIVVLKIMFIILIMYTCMCVCVGMYAREHRSWSRPEALDPCSWSYRWL